MPHVVEINCLEHLDRYRLAWSSLWRRTRRASFAQSLEWFDAVFRCDRSAVRPRVLLVLDDDDEPLGILPLLVREEASAVGTLRVLGYPLALGLGFCGPVGNQPTATLQLALQHVARKPRDWDVLDLCGIEAAYLDGRRTTTGLHFAGFEAALEPWQDHACIELGPDWHDYWNRREAERRTHLEQVERRLDERAAVTHVRYRPEGTMHGEDDPRWDLYADCLTVARRSRASEASAGLTLDTPQWVELFRQAHQAAARLGTLDVNLLYVDGTAAAFSYHYVVDGTVTRVVGGCDPRFADDEVEAVLTAAWLKQSHAWGDRAFDLGPARDRWTSFWKTRDNTSLRAVHYPPTVLRTQALKFGRVWQRRLLKPLHAATAGRQTSS